MPKALDRMKTALDGAALALSGALSLAEERAEATRATQREVDETLATITRVSDGSKIIYCPPPAELLAPPPFEVTEVQMDEAIRQVNADWLAACQRTEREPSVTIPLHTVTHYLEAAVREGPPAALAYLTGINEIFAILPIHRSCLKTPSSSA